MRQNKFVIVTNKGSRLSWPLYFTTLNLFNSVIQIPLLLSSCTQFTLFHTPFFSSISLQNFQKFSPSFIIHFLSPHLSNICILQTHNPFWFYILHTSIFFILQTLSSSPKASVTYHLSPRTTIYRILYFRIYYHFPLFPPIFPISSLQVSLPSPTTFHFPALPFFSIRQPFSSLSNLQLY